MNTVILLGIICITIYYCITWYVNLDTSMAYKLQIIITNLINLFFFFFFGCVFSNRMLPKIIGYFFIKRFNTQIKFGRVSLPFTLRAVKIIKNGFSIVSIVCIKTAYISVIDNNVNVIKNFFIAN